MNQTIALLKTSPVQRGFMSKAELHLLVMEALIQVLSNMQPSQVSLVILNQALSINDPMIQEASLSALEKWENPEYLFLLQGRRYANHDLWEYARDISNQLSRQR